MEPEPRLSQPQGPSQSLTCSCGFFTSHPDYMLTHVAEGNCTISDGQAALVRQRLQAIHTDQTVTRMHLVYLDNEQNTLNLILQMRPLTPRAKLRHCHVCGKLTALRSGNGERAQCADHVRHTLLDILRGDA